MAGGGQSRTCPQCAGKAPALFSPFAVSPQVTREERAAGIAWARAWRRHNKPMFDALYGPDERDCPSYGGWMQAEAQATAAEARARE